MGKSIPKVTLLHTLLFAILNFTSCTADKADSEECLACADLLDMPCHMGLEVEATYYYCDPCGTSWRCALTGAETNDFLRWAASDVPCACIDADGSRDTADPDCAG